MSSRKYKKIVLEKLDQLLKPRGFTKSGANFRKKTPDLIYYINLQSSKSSTAMSLKATVNLEISSRAMAKKSWTLILMHYERHWTSRIGHLLEDPVDKWWTISNEFEAEEAGTEIVGIFVNKVLPEFGRIKTTSDLADLWRDGKSPGMTEMQRLKYLRLADLLKVN